MGTPNDIFDKMFKDIDTAYGEVIKMIDLNRRLGSKPKRFVLDTWIDHQDLIGGKTLVWYYCDVIEDIRAKVI